MQSFTPFRATTTPPPLNASILLQLQYFVKAVMCDTFGLDCPRRAAQYEMC